MTCALQSHLSFMQVLELRGVCVKGMLNNVTIDNLFDYMVAADACSEEQLIQACLTFAVKHRLEISLYAQLFACMLSLFKEDVQCGRTQFHISLILPIPM